jgi:hypothetical protein
MSPKCSADGPGTENSERPLSRTIFWKRSHHWVFVLNAMRINPDNLKEIIFQAFSKFEILESVRNRSLFADSRREVCQKSIKFNKFFPSEYRHKILSDCKIWRKSFEE